MGGRKLIYRIMGLFEANNAVFIAMLKLICAKIYLFATNQRAKSVCNQDITFPDKLKCLLNPPSYQIYKNNQRILSKQYNEQTIKYQECKENIDQQSKEKDDNQTNDAKESKEKMEDDKLKKLETLKNELIAMENQMNFIKKRIPPRLSTSNALIIYELILMNIANFKYMEDRQLLFKSRLVCSLLSVIIKVSKPKEKEWIDCNQKLLALMNEDFTFLVPGLTRLRSPNAKHTNNKFVKINPPTYQKSDAQNVHQSSFSFEGREYFKVRGRELSQWTVLMASPRIRWELITDFVCGFDEKSAKKLYNLPKFWKAVQNAMFYFPAARFLAHRHIPLKQELFSYFSKIKQKAQAQIEQNKKEKKAQSDNKEKIENAEKVKRSVSDSLMTQQRMNGTFDTHPYSLSVHTQSMHHYVDDLKKWLDAFKKNEAAILEKEKEHQHNMEKQKKRQMEYEQILQLKKDRQNEQFKQQFFKQLKIKKITKKPIEKKEKKEVVVVEENKKCEVEKEKKIKIKPKEKKIAIEDQKNYKKTN